MVITSACYSATLTPSCTKSALMTSIHMSARRKYFDLAIYPKTCPFYDRTNRKVVGKVMIEANANTVVEFVGLKA